MSRLFGPLRQMGYVVPDVEAAMHHWVTVCGVARNVSYGHDSGLGCHSVTLTFRPTADLFTPHATATGKRTFILPGLGR